MITKEIIAQFIKAWYEAHGERLSVTKATKRLQKAVDIGCPLLSDCSKCDKVCNCPILLESNS